MADPATLGRPLAAGRRAFTLPTRLHSDGKGRTTSPSKDAVVEGVETLFACEAAKIISFDTPPLPRSSSTKTGSLQVTADDPSVAGTLPWASKAERILAAGPLRIYRVHGTVAFLSSGSTFSQRPIQAKTQCWCVDGETRFVLRIRPPNYYRIEFPHDTSQGKQAADEFRAVLTAIALFERTSCPFRRGFYVELPETPETIKKPWRPKAQYVPSPSKANSHRNSTPYGLESGEDTTDDDGHTISSAHTSSRESDIDTSSELSSNSPQSTETSPPQLAPKKNDEISLVDVRSKEAMYPLVHEIQIPDPNLSSTQRESSPKDETATHIVAERFEAKRQPEELALETPTTANSLRSTHTAPATAGLSLQMAQSLQASPSSEPCIVPPGANHPDRSESLDLFNSQPAETSKSSHMPMDLGSGGQDEHTPLKIELPQPQPYNNEVLCHTTTPTSAALIDSDESETPSWHTVPERPFDLDIRGRSSSTSAKDDTTMEAPGMLRERLQRRRANSPLPSPANLYTPSNHQIGYQLSEAILQKTYSVLMGPPAQLIALMLNIAARILRRGGDDLPMGKRKIPCSWEFSEDEGDDNSDASWNEDDYGFPLGKLASNMSRTNESVGGSWEID